MREGIPSFTALAIAYFVLILGQTACELLVPGTVPLQMALLEAVKLPWKQYLLLLLLRSPIGPIFSRFLRWLGDKLCKNGMEAVAYRKLFINEKVKQFLDDHINNKKPPPQVLILAAGYDTLSLRLSRQYPAARFWEIDHPATGNFKNRIWESNNDDDKSRRSGSCAGPMRIIGEKPSNLFDASVDLTQPNALAETLLLNGEGKYSISSPTIVILEGLTMYLTTPQIQSLFDQISKSVGKGSMCLFDMLATKYDDAGQQQQPDIGVLTTLVGWYIKIKGEPWLLGLTTEILKEFVDKSDAWNFASEVQSFGPTNLAAMHVN